MRARWIGLGLLVVLGGCRLGLTRSLEPGELRGTLVFALAGETEAPAVGASIHLEGANATLRTDHAGRFIVRGLVAGTYALQVSYGTDPSAPTHGLRLGGLTLGIADDGTTAGRDLGKVVLGKLGRLQGRVLQGGVPVDGARVVLPGLAESISNEGNFSFDSLVPGSQELVVETVAGVVTFEPVDVLANEPTTRDLELGTATAALEGAVIGSVRVLGAHALADISVLLPGSGQLAVRTTADGSFRTPPLPPGIYTLLVEAADLQPLQRPFTVVDGETDVGLLTLAMGDAGCALGGLPVGAPPDLDADGIDDAAEDAPCRCVPGARDADNDGLCDTVDRDLDDDGVADVRDNCPGDANGDQLDSDDDGLGDACDPPDVPIAPTVLSTIPSDGATEQPRDTVIRITFSWSMDPGTLDATSFAVTTGAAPVAGQRTMVAEDTAALFTPDASFPADTTLFVTVGGGLRDAFGTAFGTPHAFSFRTAALNDTTPPAFVGSAPGDGDMNVAVDGLLSVTFDETLAASSVTADKLLLVAGTSAIPFTFSTSGAVVTLDPDAPLAPATDHTLTIGPGLTDLAGNPTNTTRVIDFRTGSDGVPPVLVGRFPLDAAPAVPVATYVSATFDRPLDPSTVTDVTFRLLDPAGSAIPATRAVTDRTIELRPLAPLQPSMDHAVELTTGVTDLDGDALRQPISWGFRTAALGVRVLSAGDDHACAIRDDGSLWCWGNNVQLRLPGDTSVPVRVGTDNDWTSVSVAYQTHCGLRAGGHLWCWGSNGNNVIDGGSSGLSRPLTEVHPGQVWTDVAVALQHSCALREDGTVWCWGSGCAGILGNNRNDCSPFPTPSLAASNILSIDAGERHTCAIDVNHSLWCWGANYAGQLGDGTTTNALVAKKVSADTDWVSVDGAMFHTCGVRSSGEITCAGDNSQGQLGPLVGAWPRTFQAITTGVSWATVRSLSSVFTCGTRTGGGAWCWGSGGAGNLGDGTYDIGIFPPVAVSGGASMDQVEVGVGYACGVANGRVSCWGLNDVGRLGDGRGKPHFSPTRIGSGNDWVSISAGSAGGVPSSGAVGQRSCGLRDDRSLWCWGAHAPVRVATQASWVAVSGSPTPCALEDGPSAGERALWCTDSALMAPFTRLGTEVDWQRVSTWGNHACGLRAGGSLWCWGYNVFGVLGDGTSTASLGVPVREASAATGWRDVAVGMTNTFAIAADRSLWAWGRGFLGNATIASMTPLRTEPSPDWDTVDVGQNHACARRTDDSLWCWGSNATGQLGTTVSLGSSIPTPVAVPGGLTFRSFATGSEHSCGVTVDGRLFCWGATTLGQVALPAGPSSPTPTQVGADTDWLEVAAAEAHTCARRSDRSLWCWGGHAFTGTDDYRAAAPRDVVFP